MSTSKSPDGVYVAWVISSDQGAMGGATNVCVRNCSQDIKLLGGELRLDSECIWTGNWGSMPSVSWEDNDTLLIDGKQHNMDEILDKH